MKNGYAIIEAVSRFYDLDFPFINIKRHMVEEAQKNREESSRRGFLPYCFLIEQL